MTAIDIVQQRLGELARTDVPIGPKTTYRVGGSAALYVEITSEADLQRVAEALAGSEIEVVVIGKGSNMLVADEGFDGLALSLGEVYGRTVVGRVGVRAGGAAYLPVVARQTVRDGMTGFEWAVGVPGSIGGAVRMNAGGHGSEMVEVLSRARIADLQTGQITNVPVADLGLGYRTSKLEAHHVVISADLALAAGDREQGERELSEIVAWRRANQPGGQNAGSVFANPPGDSAGRLIDAAGCKGLRVGSAEVSPKHANFFQADSMDSGGSADDVWALMDEVRRQVHDASGVVLRPETRLVGFPPLPELGVAEGSTQ